MQYFQIHQIHIDDNKPMTKPANPAIIYCFELLLDFMYLVVLCFNSYTYTFRFYFYRDISYHSVLSLLDCTLGTLTIREFWVLYTFHIWSFNFVAVMPHLFGKVLNIDGVSEIHNILFFLPPLAPIFLGSLPLPHKSVVQFELIPLSLPYTLHYQFSYILMQCKGHFDRFSRFAISLVRFDKIKFRSGNFELT